MEPVKVTTVGYDRLISIARTILEKSLEAKDDEGQLSKIAEEYRGFAEDFPTVFEIMLYEKIFSVKCFTKYLEFRRKKPVVYRKEEESIEDLIEYPLYLWEKCNAHYDKKDHIEYANYLRKEIGDAHRQHKKIVKDMYKQYEEQKEKDQAERMLELEQEILKMAAHNVEQNQGSELSI